MMAKTHIVIGLSCAVPLLPHVQSNYYSLEDIAGICIGLFIGSLLPDIDHPQSLISQFIPLIGLTVSRLIKHRGLSHSLLGMVILSAICSLGLMMAGHTSFSFMLVSGLLVGAGLHILADAFTVSGVRLLYPMQYRLRLGMIKTGGYIEMIIRYAFMIYILSSLWIVRGFAISLIF